MSVILISDTMISSVCGELTRLAIARTGMEDTPLGVGYIFGSPTTFELAEKEVGRFCEMAMRFNIMEWNAMFGKKHGNIEYTHDSFLNSLKAKRVQLTPVSLYKQIQFINYNCNPDCEMSRDEYEKWPMREEYEEFLNKCNRLEALLSTHIISHMKEYNDSPWGF